MLAQRRTYDLVSSFRPSYNMAVNLARNYTEDQAHHLLNSSFAQFLADRKVVGLERAPARRRGDRRDRANMRCHLGDFDEYWSLVSRARHIREEDRKDHERPEPNACAAVGKLRPGGDRRPERQAGRPRDREPAEGKPTVLTQDRRFFRLSPRLPGAARGAHAHPAAAVGNARSSRYRRDGGQARRAPGAPSKPGRHRPDARAEREAATRGPCGSAPARMPRATGTNGGPGASTSAWLARAHRAAHPREDRDVGATVRPRSPSSGARVRGGLDVTERAHLRGSTVKATSWWPRPWLAGLFDDLTPAEVAAPPLVGGVRGPRTHPPEGEMPTAASRSGTICSSARGGGCAAPRTSTRCSSAASSSRVRHPDLPLGERTAARRRARRDRHGAGRLRTQLQAVGRPFRQVEEVAPPTSPGRSVGAIGRAPRRRGVHRPVATMRSR